jgi:hypothetical protein
MAINFFLRTAPVNPSEMEQELRLLLLDLDFSETSRIEESSILLGHHLGSDKGIEKRLLAGQLLVDYTTGYRPWKQDGDRFNGSIQELSLRLKSSAPVTTLDQLRKALTAPFVQDEMTDALRILCVGYLCVAASASKKDQAKIPSKITEHLDSHLMESTLKYRWKDVQSAKWWIACLGESSNAGAGRGPESTDLLRAVQAGEGIKIDSVLAAWGELNRVLK